PNSTEIGSMGAGVRSAKSRLLRWLLVAGCIGCFTSTVAAAALDFWRMGECSTNASCKWHRGLPWVYDNGTGGSYLLTWILYLIWSDYQTGYPSFAFWFWLSSGLTLFLCAPVQLLAMRWDAERAAKAGLRQSQPQKLQQAAHIKFVMKNGSQQSRKTPAASAGTGASATCRQLARRLSTEPTPPPPPLPQAPPLELCRCCLKWTGHRRLRVVGVILLFLLFPFFVFPFGFVVALVFEISPVAMVTAGVSMEAAAVRNRRLPGPVRPARVRPHQQHRWRPASASAILLAAAVVLGGALLLLSQCDGDFVGSTGSGAGSVWWLLLGIAAVFPPAAAAGLDVLVDFAPSSRGRFLSSSPNNGEDAIVQHQHYYAGDVEAAQAGVDQEVAVKKGADVAKFFLIADALQILQAAADWQGDADGQQPTSGDGHNREQQHPLVRMRSQTQNMADSNADEDLSNKPLQHTPGALHWHDDRSHQDVGKRQRHNEIIGDALQSSLSVHSQHHQDVAKDELPTDDDDDVPLRSQSAATAAAAAAAPVGLAEPPALEAAAPAAAAPARGPGSVLGAIAKIPQSPQQHSSICLCHSGRRAGDKQLRLV
uniref:G_PROTEIN_RECEP_F2_4 domain-containing protein n=1 Tax=Macrostomum lignano TaxID=282301 RepID=A0A1I8IWU8_9PLAT